MPVTSIGVLMTQVPAPEIPPIFVSTGGPPAEIIIFGILAATVILWPLVRALARRLEHKGIADAAHIEELEARVAELEDRQLRMGELEERMEFAERLLAQQREQSKLGP